VKHSFWFSFKLLFFHSSLFLPSSFKKKKKNQKKSFLSFFTSLETFKVKKRNDGGDRELQKTVM